MENNEQDIVKSMNEDRKLAEDFILNYEKHKKDYERKKRDWLEQGRPSVDTNVGGGKGNLPGHPVEDMAIKSADYDAERPRYLWLRAVGIALRTFGERKRIFIACRQEAEQQKKFWRGQRMWVLYAQRRYSEEISKRYINGNGWVSDRTIKAWWHQILDRVVEIHLRLK